MIKELTDIVNIAKENWYTIPPIALGIYGCTEYCRGLYEIIKTANKGLVKTVIGISVLGFAGISAPILYKIAEHLQR